MQRLLEDAQKITGVKYDITNLNDVFQAIHAIQGKLEITGTTSKEAEETISGSVASMKSAWDNFLNGSGTFDQFVDAAKIAFNNIAKAVSELLPRIASEIANALPSEFVTAVKIITPILVTLGTALGVIWGYFKMVSIVNAISKAFSILNAIMMANPILLIVALIAGLVAGFIYLWNTSESFRNFWIGLWEGIKTAFENVWNAISTFFTQTIPQAFQGLLDKISEIGNNIKTFFENLWNGIISFFTETIPQWIQNVINWFAQLPYMIGYHIGQILGNIVQFGINAWNWITTDLPQIIQNIINWFAQLPGRIWEWLCNVVNNIVQWGQNIYNTASSWISNTINNIINWFSQLPGRIWTWLISTLEKIKNWITNTRNTMSNGIHNIISSVIQWFSELPGKMVDIGKNIVTGIWNGIVNAKNWMINKVKEFAKGILDGMKNALGIHSPSREAAKISKYIPSGVAVGIDANTDEALKAVKNMDSAIIDEMNKAVNMETGSINAKASVKSNNSMTTIIQADFAIDGSVNIDGQKTGRILTPYMTKTLKTGGAFT